MNTRCLVLVMLAMGCAAQTARAAADASAGPATGLFDGIWFPDQGVLWDVSVPAGQPPRAPFTPEYARRYQQALDASARGKPVADRTTRCLPPGMPRILGAPLPFEVVTGADTIYALHEYMGQVRRIYLEGRGPQPLGGPSFNGHSTGNWRDGVLTVDTVDLGSESVLDTTGLPYSAALTVREQWRIIAQHKLEIAITLIDPEAFTAPWTVVRTYTRKPGERVLEYVCAENNRNTPNPDGTTGFVGIEP